jgi:hypothetical protein
MRRVFLGVLAAALILGLMREARAGDVWGVVSVGSYHTDRAAHYNENNPGLGVEIGVSENWRLIGGEYLNSFYHNSRYAGASYTPLHLGPAHFGAAAFAVTGYRSKAAPAGALVAAFEWERAGFNILAVPPLPNIPGVVALQVKVRFLP